MTDLVRVKRALISVSDKTGIVEFTRALQDMGIELLSTGGTYRLLRDHDIPVVEVSEYTGFPEMMSGRVKTLHPKIHGGILGRRGTDDATMEEHGIQAIDMVVVNLYPFSATIAQEDCSLATAIENIDIGGPTMVRAAAKNHKDVAIVVDPNRYEYILNELQNHQGGLTESFRLELATSAFEHTAGYDSVIANYLGGLVETHTQKFPRTINTQFKKAQALRYGENPHQEAALYIDSNSNEASVTRAQQLQGKELSFNNIADTDAALETVKLFERPTCVIVKHANPCGVAEGDNIESAYERAFATDPESAFGGIIAFNCELDGATAKNIVERQFVEVIIAPHISTGAQEVLANKKNIRVLQCGDWSKPILNSFDYKKVTGGLLIQDRDLAMVTADELEVVTKKTPSAQEMEDLLFSWKVAKMVKSNAIIYGNQCQTIGIGAGQMSRVNSARIAAIKAEHAGLQVEGSVMASDAFFPFRDGIDNAAAVGITAVIQPGGSMKDDEVIAAADEHDIAMVFTKIRHFRH